MSSTASTSASAVQALQAYAQARLNTASAIAAKQTAMVTITQTIAGLDAAIQSSVQAENTTWAAYCALVGK